MKSAETISLGKLRFHFQQRFVYQISYAWPFQRNTLSITEWENSGTNGGREIIDLAPSQSRSRTKLNLACESLVFNPTPYFPVFSMDQTIIKTR